LSGIAKRELPGVELLAIKGPDDLAVARRLIESRPQHAQGEHTPEWRIVVTPAKGVFTRAGGIDEGSDVPRGARLGTIATNREEHEIIAPAAGVLTEWLREDGDIVAAGLPVARLHNGADV
jgi:[acyl-carrier-protein] S-malonyltransferase